MECNKEEAFRAKEIAEKKMQGGDFAGARRIALKARQLYPNLDNISQMVMVCEVHCSAQNKLNGSEMDWYGILQIEKFSDETVIKKQFRKLALTLHPDKNKFAGAEAAFKLIGEANRVLTDPTKRQAYDMKCRSSLRPVASKPQSDHSNKNSFVKKNEKQQVAANKFSNAPHSQYMSSHNTQLPKKLTFWTGCPSCHVRYEYYRDFLKKMLRCQTCQQPFIAHDLGIPPGAIFNQFTDEKRVPNHGPSRVVPPNYDGKPSGMSFPNGFSWSKATAKVEKAVDVGLNKPKELKVESATCTGGSAKSQENVNGHTDVKAGSRGFPSSMPEAMQSKVSGTSQIASNKRCGKLGEEFSDNFDKSKKAGNKENVVTGENGGDIYAQNCGFNADHQFRKSSRQKQQTSYKENFDDDDFVEPPPKRSRASSSSYVNDEQMKTTGVDARVPKAVSVDSAASLLNGRIKEAKQNASSNFEERSSGKKSKSGESGAKGEDASMSERAGAELGSNNEISRTSTSDLNLNDALKTEVFHCADPDFSNFESERAENIFCVNQVWAIYDSHDGMPRFYVRIRKVFTPGFKLQITWFESVSDKEAEQQWCEEGLPVGCGMYENGDTEETEDRMMFSHQMKRRNGGRRGTYWIYPKKGETWALFKDWDADWCLEPDKHRPPYRFEFVVVLTDFTEDTGIGVAYLEKVNGFVSIFQQASCDDVLSFYIRPSELYRFSHHVPSFRMSGREGEGVPAGSFELDTAALPSNFSCMVDSENTFKNIGSGPNMETSALGNSLRESIGTCKDDNQDGHKVASHGKLTQPEGIAHFQANNEKISNHTKQEEDKFVAVSLTPRRSPRDLSKRSSRANSSEFTLEDTGKHLATSRDSRNDQSGVSSRHSDNKTLLHSKDGRRFISPLKGSSSSGCRVVEIEEYDFRKDKSEDSFQLGQIWAVYSDKDGLPRNYVQVKKIESTTGFRLHVAMLESCTLQKDTGQLLACGTFRAKNGKLTVLRIGAFSHKVKAKSTGRSTYEIYPRRGEIWAVYKNWNSESMCSNQGAGGCDIVEVVEDNSSNVKVAVLKPVKGVDIFYMSPSLKRPTSSIMDIPLTEFSRFSHQCLAHRHVGKNSSHLRGYWQLDPASIPDSVILVE